MLETQAKNNGAVWPQLSITLILLTITVFCSSLQAEEFEPKPNLIASEVLPAELLSSDLHQVDEIVFNDGFMNTYTLNSEFGEQQVYGLTLLRVRVQEIIALDELDNIEESDVYVDAAVSVLKAPIDSVGQFVAQPVETVKGIPSGLGRMMRGIGRTASSMMSSGEKNGENDGTETTVASEAETYALKFMGVNKAQRKWAEKLAVDPYSSNQLLQENIAKVAKIDTLTGFGTKLLMPGLGVVGMAATTSSMVWNIAPAELRRDNLKRLKEQGASQDQIDNFLNNAWYSPTLQTVITMNLLAMEGTENRAVALEAALIAGSEEQAVFFTDTVRMLGRYYATQGRLKSLTYVGGLLGGLTIDNHLIKTFPIDHMIWTQVAADYVNSSIDQAAEAVGDSGRELWLRGDASPTAVRMFSEHGWVVYQNTDLL